MGKKILALVAGILFVFATTGCPTTNWAHNKRHLKKIRMELHELHMEIDRIFFGLEEDPSEV